VKESGVTLLELLITMSIVMILASVAMPLSKISARRQQEIELRQRIHTISASSELNPRLEHGYSLSEIGRAVSLHYSTVSRVVNVEPSRNA